MPRTGRPAVFLDRDGVLIVEKDFLNSTEDIEFYPETIESLRSIKSQYLKIVISNQSGVARGYFSSKDVEKLNSHLSELLADNGISIDAWYFCPHGPDDGCSCRKPAPGMILEAADKLDIDLSKSWIIGDKSSDIEAGMTSGVKTILVKSGYAGAEPGSRDIKPDFTAADIREAVDYINRSRF
jgi:D-glycero-D-manno-heptose 1,7-bisphosphate phosphatase